MNQKLLLFSKKRRLTWIQAEIDRIRLASYRLADPGSSQKDILCILKLSILPTSYDQLQKFWTFINVCRTYYFLSIRSTTTTTTQTTRKTAGIPRRCRLVEHCSLHSHCHMSCLHYMNRRQYQRSKTSIRKTLFILKRKYYI